VRRGAVDGPAIPNGRDPGFAYDPGFTGGVTVACADVSGDGHPDIVTGTGPGGAPHVRVFSGPTGVQLPGAIGSFFAYDAGFTGGVTVAAGDVNGNVYADVIVGTGPGGAPDVRTFSGASGALLDRFFAFDDGVVGGVAYPRELP
jgi:hypothetical protein